MISFTLTILLPCAFLVSANIRTESQVDYELFGPGLTPEVVSKSRKLHMSSSTEDLANLVLQEFEFVNLLISESDGSKLSHAKKYLSEIDYPVTLEEYPDPVNYVSHPINAYHLLKRITLSLPKLSKFYNETKEFKSLILPDKQGKNDFLNGATFGLLNLQFHHGLDISDMAKGATANVDYLIFNNKKV